MRLDRRAVSQQSDLSVAGVFELSALFRHQENMSLEEVFGFSVTIGSLFRRRSLVRFVQKLN